MAKHEKYLDLPILFTMSAGIWSLLLTSIAGSMSLYALSRIRTIVSTQVVCCLLLDISSVFCKSIIFRILAIIFVRIGFFEVFRAFFLHVFKVLIFLLNHFNLAYSVIHLYYEITWKQVLAHVIILYSYVKSASVAPALLYVLNYFEKS